jgi:hypothetical protein
MRLIDNASSKQYRATRFRLYCISRHSGAAEVRTTVFRRLPVSQCHFYVASVTLNNLHTQDRKENINIDAITRRDSKEPDTVAREFRSPETTEIGNNDDKGGRS